MLQEVMAAEGDHSSMASGSSDLASPLLPMEATRFNLTAKRVPAQVFFQDLIQKSDQNIIVSPKVSGKISLSLKQVTVDEALTFLESLYGYRIERIGGAFLVQPVAEESKFSIAVNEVPAREFFLSLVKDTPYNVVLHPDIKGTISLNLDNVTIHHILEVVRTVYGYEYELNESTFVIKPKQLETRIFEIDYLFVKRKGRSSLSVAASSVRGTTTTTNATGQTSESKGQGTGSDLETTLPELDVWKELGETLQGIIGDQEGHKVYLNPSASLVVVKAFPSELRRIETYLKQFGLTLNRQVIIEAKVIEVRLNDQFQTGINWGALAKFGQGVSLAAGQTAANQAAGFASNLANGGNLIADTTTRVLSGIPVTPVGGSFAAAINAKGFQVFMEYLDTQGDVQVLSSPRVSTMNNQKAMIKIGTDSFFVTDVGIETTTNADGDSVPTLSGVDLSPFFSGIALDVTPQIREDNSVLLHVHPTISEVVASSLSIDFNNSPMTLPLARSDLRESDSIVLAQSGQVVIIGGLMQKKIEYSTEGVPFLNAIPLVGRALSHQTQSKIKSELVILLRPLIVENQDQWTLEIVKTMQRMRNVRPDKREKSLSAPLQLDLTPPQTPVDRAPEPETVRPPQGTDQPSTSRTGA